ncbi:helix-turn-helix transcriptional regulator [Stutzerimonas kirkiae]|uniref:LuxR family transcriptional regulator n=1 Tax=Stutzerimonas kirkiae TaxID=2211392 RepID=A0A4Q9RCJ6_9GAMM|nr:helix-turn-helix transcriptional regulator [Stutzerimonas kirkiae]TBU98909.1 LuxR family transcriptional regulator [Stutzerimonas kirkiae]TBV01559.1 LuxR family transcriptional regulator [Stutzerimonas kirkiae]TBV10337.1 LuxR family transcriptional regulator [Stutzerimonas kirkiae]TBV16870.1 LuxR family transcriptional regulator [Stutzerimonas kirkiae]
MGGPVTQEDRALAQALRALGQPSFAEAFAHYVRRLVPFDNLIILAYHKDRNPVAFYRECVDPVVYQNMDGHYLKAAYLLDPYYHAHASGLRAGVHQLFDLAPDQFRQTSYFREYYQNTTLVDEVAVFASLGHDTTLTACFGRDRSSGRLYSKREVQMLKRREHALTALCEVHWHDYDPGASADITLAPVIERLRLALRERHDIRLSPRQAEVAMYILRGHSSLSISLNLGISVDTVKVFRRQLYGKCNISSQAELFALLMPIFSSL